MSKLVSAIELEAFLHKIKKTFPTMVAGIIVDKHGFPMHSEIEKPDLDENLLALSAITNRKLINIDDYQKVVRPLGINAKLLILLKKSHQNLHRFKTFNKLLKENPIEN